jgi:hypothetical protein
MTQLNCSAWKHVVATQWSRRNIDELDSLLAESLIWTHFSARQDTKASFLAGIRAGTTRYLDEAFR